MKFSILWKNELLADIETEPRKSEVKIKKYDVRPMIQIFQRGKIDRERIYEFIKSRCMEEGRGDIEEILEELGLEEYDPWKMVQITHGVDWDDFYWIRFEGENLTWEDVRVRC